MIQKLVTIALMIIILNVMSSPLQAQKIGLLLDSYVTDRWYLDQKLFSDRVKELGGEVQLEIAYGDTMEQLRLAKKLLAEGVKVLVVVSVDGVKAVEIVQAAKQVNIPVVAYDRLIYTNDIDIYISYDNEKVGELQAEYALSKIPKGKFLLLNGPVRDNNAILYRNGQYKVLKKSIDDGKIKIIGDFVLDDWGEIGALMRMDEFLSSTKERPDVIIAANDALASGAIQALPAGLRGKVVVTGQDADLTSIRFIIGGAQTMTTYKPIKPVANLAAEVAIKLAKGQHVEGSSKLKYENIEVNAILLKPIVVDKTNYKDVVVKDGHVSLSELMDNR